MLVNSSSAAVCGLSTSGLSGDSSLWQDNEQLINLYNFLHSLYTGSELGKLFSCSAGYYLIIQVYSYVQLFYWILSHHSLQEEIRNSALQLRVRSRIHLHSIHSFVDQAVPHPCQTGTGVKPIESSRWDACRKRVNFIILTGGWGWRIPTLDADVHSKIVWRTAYLPWRSCPRRKQWATYLACSL